MSQWTHLAGIIRLDNIGGAMVRFTTDRKNEKIKEAVAKALGNTCNYDSPVEAWDHCTVPCGSEGSLQYKVFPNSDSDEDNHALSWGYAVIWADLRDFGSEDVPKIEKWFQEGLAKLEKPEGFNPLDQMDMLEKAEYMLSVFSIREAVLNIDVESQPRTILVWDGDASKIIRLCREENERKG